MVSVTQTQSSVWPCFCYSDPKQRLALFLLLIPEAAFGPVSVTHTRSSVWPCFCYSGPKQRLALFLLLRPEAVFGPVSVTHTRRSVWPCFCYSDPKQRLALFRRLEQSGQLCPVPAPAKRPDLREDYFKGSPSAHATKQSRIAKSATVSSDRDHGTIMGLIFSPIRQLVRFSHPKMPFFPNSEFI